MYVCMYVCSMYLCMNVECMYLCMYVCSMYLCMYVCRMYVSIYVCMYVYRSIFASMCYTYVLYVYQPSTYRDTRSSSPSSRCLLGRPTRKKGRKSTSESSSRLGEPWRTKKENRSCRRKVCRAAVRRCEFRAQDLMPMTTTVLCEHYRIIHIFLTYILYIHTYTVFSEI